MSGAHVGEWQDDEWQKALAAKALDMSPDRLAVGHRRGSERLLYTQYKNTFSEKFSQTGNYYT